MKINVSPYISKIFQIALKIKKSKKGILIVFPRNISTVFTFINTTFNFFNFINFFSLQSC